MIKKSIYLLICITLSFLPKSSLGQNVISKLAVQSNPIFKTDENVIFLMKKTPIPYYFHKKLKINIMGNDLVMV